MTEKSLTQVQSTVVVAVVVAVAVAVAVASVDIIIASCAADVTVDESTFSFLTLAHSFA